MSVKVHVHREPEERRVNPLSLFGCDAANDWGGVTTPSTALDP